LSSYSLHKSQWQNGKDGKDGKNGEESKMEKMGKKQCFRRHIKAFSPFHSCTFDLN
jgi:hypothetical protein